jgi:hypothetical protein
MHHGVAHVEHPDAPSHDFVFGDLVAIIFWIAIVCVDRHTQ